METIVTDFNDALPDVYGDFHEEFKALVNLGVTKSALRRAVKRSKERKCMTCPFHGKDFKDLKNHLVKHKGHFYGVERLNNEKKDFIDRLLESHPALADQGIQEFNDVHGHYAEFEDHEKSEYEELLFLSMLQIKLSRRKSN